MSRSDGYLFIAYILGLPTTLLIVLEVANDTSVGPSGGQMHTDLTAAVTILIGLLWCVVGIGYLATSPSINLAWSNRHLIFQFLAFPFQLLGVFAGVGLFLCTCGVLALLFSHASPWPWR